MLSEEAADDVSRVDADRVWIVDPVDGTHEFSMPGRADWAVHIALWQRVRGPAGGITDAAVALPARGEVYRTDTVPPPPPRTRRADPHHRQRQPAAGGAVVAARPARHRARPDRIGGRQGDGRGPR